MYRILALSGSLRAASINSALLRAARRLAPEDMVIDLFGQLGELPLFNPDLENQPPSVVLQLRQQLQQADALLIASPEYAHGVSGTIKNSLDWLVSFAPFAGKLVLVWNASPRAYHADAALREILTTMSAQILEPASISIPLLSSKLDEDGMVASASVAAAIQQALNGLYEALSTPNPPNLVGDIL